MKKKTSKIELSAYFDLMIRDLFSINLFNKRIANMAAMKNANSAKLY